MRRKRIDLCTLGSRNVNLSPRASSHGYPDIRPIEYPVHPKEISTLCCLGEGENEEEDNRPVQAQQ